MSLGAYDPYAVSLLSTANRSAAIQGPEGPAGPQGARGAQGPTGSSRTTWPEGIPIPQLDDYSAALLTLYYSLNRRCVVYKDADGLLWELTGGVR